MGRCKSPMYLSTVFTSNNHPPTKHSGQGVTIFWCVRKNKHRLDMPKIMDVIIITCFVSHSHRIAYIGFEFNRKFRQKLEFAICLCLASLVTFFHPPVGHYFSSLSLGGHFIIHFSCRCFTCLSASSFHLFLLSWPAVMLWP